MHPVLTFLLPGRIDPPVELDQMETWFEAWVQGEVTQVVKRIERQNRTGKSGDLIFDFSGAIVGTWLVSQGVIRRIINSLLSVVELFDKVFCSRLLLFPGNTLR